MKVKTNSIPNLSTDRLISILDLADIMIECQSFSFGSFDDAKLNIVTPNMECCFDRLTLNLYSCSLNDNEKSKLLSTLQKRLLNQFSHNDIKTHKEYHSLFYLITKHNLFSDYTICKSIRPDFVLKGAKCIGIEETEFTTQRDKIMLSMSRDLLGKELSPEKMRLLATHKHGRKAGTFKYIKLGTSVGIMGPTYATSTNHQEYAKEIVKKYNKYKNHFSEFDEFIILCNAQSSISVADNEDIADIVSLAQSIQHDMTGFRLLILWVNDSSVSQLTSYKF